MSKTFIIGISGPSSSGKTTLARLLLSIFQPQSSLSTFIIHEDDFYVPDDQIPHATLPSGQIIQDWDTVDAIDIPFLTDALAYVRTHGSLPPRLKSKEDLNETKDAGVDSHTITQIRDAVAERLKSSGNKVTLALVEGILLFSPPEAEVKEHKLRSVHANIDVHLFLPAPYDLVKARRESRSGYVTTGPAPVPDEVPPRHDSASSSPKGPVDLEKEGDSPPQNFWVDPPGYVDDIVWPRYVQDHAWLLLPEKQSQDRTSNAEEDLIKRIGKGVNVRTDAGVTVAPGQGGKPMADTLIWAVEEIVNCLLTES